MVGQYNGRVRFFANTGSRAVAAFVERTGASNPFDSFSIPMGCSSISPLPFLSASAIMALQSAGVPSRPSFGTAARSSL